LILEFTKPPYRLLLSLDAALPDPDS
jgi:hypothetical protein